MTYSHPDPLDLRAAQERAEDRFPPPLDACELSARLAALDSLGDCAGYARMVLKAWKAGQR